MIWADKHERVHLAASYILYPTGMASSVGRDGMRNGDDRDKAKSGCVKLVNIDVNIDSFCAVVHTPPVRSRPLMISTANGKSTD